MTIWVQWIDKNPSFLEGRKSDKRRALMIGCLVDDQSGYELHFRVPLHNFFLHSGYTERTNRHDVRQTITKQHQHLSDGPNVTDLRAVVCEGQAWHAVEQRGPRGWCPIKTGKTGLSPLTRRPSAQPPLSTWNTRRASSAVEAVAAGLLSPHSSCLSPSKPMSFVDFPSYIWAEDPCLFILCLSFINLFLLSPFIHNPSSLSGCVLKPFYWHFSFIPDLNNLIYHTVVQ